MNQFDAHIASTINELLALRKDLHRYPELGFQEYRTANIISGYMIEMGIEIQTGIGGTGVIGLLRGNHPGPTIALRACLDALPVEEKSCTAYPSENPGIMHACGHDGNMTMVLGAAKVLAQHKEQLHGTVKLIFQPSEEETGGAQEIITAGGLKNPDVDVIITPHNWHGLKQGVLVVKPGPVLASSDIFHLTIIGTAGHCAWPHMAVDPIVVAADVICQLQNIISREIDPLQAATLTIGKISGGSAVNIISKTVTLEGTVRTFDQSVRNFIQTRIDAIVKGVTQAARATYELRYDRVMPPVINDPHITAKAYEALSKVFAPDMITSDFVPGMGCEEFSLFQELVPGLFLFIGNDAAEGDTIVALHAPEYIFNDAILPIGVKALCELVLAFSKNDVAKN